MNLNESEHKIDGVAPSAFLETMCEPTHFESLPDYLGKKIVEDWLDAHSVALLDRAHCSKESRLRFLQLVNGVTIRWFLPSNCSKWCSGRVEEVANLCKWVEKRNAFVEVLIMPVEMNSTPKARSAWLKEKGSKVKSISFEKGWTHKNASTLFREIAEFCPNLTKVDLSSFSNVPKTALLQRFLDAGLNTLAVACDLQAIIAKDTCVTNAGLKTLSEKNDNHLSHLDLGGCVAITNDAVCDIAWSCARLVYLDLRNTSVDDLAVVEVGAHCPLLQHLDIRDTNTENDGCVAVGKGCPELTYLACRTENDGVYAIARGCPKLLTLINWHTYVSDDAVEALATLCPGLQVLELVGTNRICCEALQFLAQHAHNLTELDVSGCRDVGDYGVGMVAQHCPKLVKLTLSGCKDLTDACAKPLAKYAQALRLLDLTRSLYISVEGIRQIAKGCKSLGWVSAACVAWLGLACNGK